MFKVYRVPAAQAPKIDALLKDNLASRQSIVVRDAKTLGAGGEGTLVLVEGAEDGVGRASAILEGLALPPAEAEAAYKRFKAQDDEAASGLGLIFSG